MAEQIVTEVEFREIEGSPGYEVSNTGEVRSWWLRGSGGKRRASEPRMLKPALSQGYPLVLLGKGRSRHVHRLVLEAFVGPCPPGMEACHNNGIRSDARLENLRWDTRKNNHADKRLHGTHQEGENNGQAKITNEQVVRIKELIVAGYLSRQISKLTGVHESTIGKIRTGKQWICVRPDLNEKFPIGYPHIPGSIGDRCKQAGLNRQTVHERLKRGWTIEEALGLVHKQKWQKKRA